MEFLGRIGRKKIYYLQVRNNPNWMSALPKNDWIAFTIANKEDEALVPPTAKVCIDKNVCYTCSAGTFAVLTEEYFDEEITIRAVDYEQKIGKAFDYDSAPVTTSHENFGEGFWFASIVADHSYSKLDKVVCLDLSIRKAKRHLIQLIDIINNGWLPNDEDDQPEFLNI